jgi:hypothetical protein
MPISRRIVIAVVCAASLSSCSVSAPKPEDADSGGGVRTPTTSAAAAAAPSQYLTRADLEKQSPGSARAALYEFWFYVQYREMSRAYQRLSQSFRTGFAESLRHFQAYVMADHSRWLAKPRVLFEEGTSTRRTFAVRYQPPGGAIVREALTFVREDKAWKLDYNFYLANRLIAE